MKELNLREIQSETLKIVKFIDKICLDLNLNYALFYGTLIGAVRHKGFIPWDDDLDIVMPRNDYDKLKEYFILHEKEIEPYKIFSYDNVNKYPYMLNRVCNTNFVMVAENEDDCSMGTFIDIYPMDGYGDGKDTLLQLRSRIYSTIYMMKSRKKYVKTNSFFTNVIKRVLNIISKFMSYKFLQNKLIEISNKYSITESEYVSCLQWSGLSYKSCYKKEDVFNTIRVPFEDTELLIPKAYDSLLRKVYGDYMQLPPEKDRIGHHFYKIYRREK